MLLCACVGVITAGIALAESGKEHYHANGVVTNRESISVGSTKLCVYYITWQTQQCIIAAQTANYIYNSQQLLPISGIDGNNMCILYMCDQYCAADRPLYIAFTVIFAILAAAIATYIAYKWCRTSSRHDPLLP